MLFNNKMPKYINMSCDWTHKRQSDMPVLSNIAPRHYTLRYLNVMSH